MKTAKYLLLLFYLTLLCGCSQSKEILPGINVPISKMNTAFKLIPNPGGDLSPKNNEFFDFEIRNLSDKVIVFPGDFGLMLFINKDNEWVRFENNLLHYPDKDYILPTHEQFSPGRQFAILPSISEMGGPVTLRVVVVGYFENQPDQKVYGYADIKLEP